jgi:phage regulator Rha-like protein
LEDTTMTDDPKDWYIECKGGPDGIYYEMTPEGFALLVMGWDGPKANQFQVEFLAKFLEMTTKLGPRNVQTKQLGRLGKAVLATLGSADGAPLKVELIKKFREMEAKLGPGAHTDEFWARWTTGKPDERAAVRPC